MVKTVSLNAVVDVFPQVDQDWLKTLMVTLERLHGLENVCERACEYISSMTEYPKNGGTEYPVIMNGSAAESDHNESLPDLKPSIGDNAKANSVDLLHSLNGGAHKRKIVEENAAKTYSPTEKRVKQENLVQMIPLDYDDLILDSDDEGLSPKGKCIVTGGLGLKNTYKNKSNGPLKFRTPGNGRVSNGQNGSVVPTLVKPETSGAANGNDSEDALNLETPETSSVTNGHGSEDVLNLNTPDTGGAAYGNGSQDILYVSSSDELLDQSDDVVFVKRESELDVFISELPNILGDDDFDLPDLNKMTKTKPRTSVVKKETLRTSSPTITSTTLPDLPTGGSSRLNNSNTTSGCSVKETSELMTTDKDELPNITRPASRPRVETSARDIGDHGLAQASDETVVDEDMGENWRNLSPVKKDLNRTGGNDAFTLPCDVCHQCSSPELLVVCYDGHLICGKCIEPVAKEIIKGQTKKFAVDCPIQDCGYTIPLVELRKILPAFIVDGMEERIEEETQKEIEKAYGIIKCPKCNFVAEPNEQDQIFTCLQCGQKLCCFCKKEYSEEAKSDHAQCHNKGSNIQQSDSGTLPEHWQTKDPAKQGFVRVPLDGNSEEYKQIAAQFYASVSATIVCIERIENPQLWRCYSLHKDLMLQKNGANDLNEKMLFHGTSTHLVETICEQNLDFRLSGNTNGTVYGQGTYFASKASLSHQYCSNRYGRITQGFNGRRMAPAYPPGQGPSSTFITPTPAGSLPQFSFTQQPQPFTLYQPIQNQLYGGPQVHYMNPQNNMNNSFGAQVYYSPNPNASFGGPFANASFGGPFANGLMEVDSGSSTPLSVPVQDAIANDPIAKLLLEKTRVKVKKYLHGWPVPHGVQAPKNQSHDVNYLNSRLPHGWPLFHMCRNIELDYLPPPRSTETQNVNVMFICRVLTGRSTKGNPSYKRPPPISNDPGSSLYDSVVDHVQNPRIFVTFERWQNYPEYIIGFAKTPHDSYRLC